MSQLEDHLTRTDEIPLETINSPAPFIIAMPTGGFVSEHQALSDAIRSLQALLQADPEPAAIYHRTGSGWVRL